MLIFSTCSKNEDEAIKTDNNTGDFFIRGVDLSFTPEIRNYNTEYQYHNKKQNIIDIVKGSGINTVRLRLWHNPISTHSSLAEVTNFAKEIKLKGLDIFLDIHYSDTWADPGAQTKPQAWQTLDINQLKNQVYNYTYEVIKTLSDAGVKPKIVQLGNEVNAGFLWDEGKVGGSYDNNWSNYAALLNQAIQATKAVDPQIKTMIHFAGFEGATSFFNQVLAQKIDYDYIGISYYPIYHGKDLEALYQELSKLVNIFNKPLMIAETAYPFTLSWNDYTHNTIGLETQTIPAYPATEKGQADFIKALIKIVKALPQQKGIGICYWAPEMVAYKGSTALDGSTIENQTLFDFNNNALPALDSLGKSK